MNKIPLIAVVGPTASGKTALAVEIAKKINAEIISFDSMQIYRELSISTAKPTEDEMQGIKHHLIDCVSVKDDFSVAMYCDEAHKTAREIFEKGKNIVLVGGTGLYLDSFVNNVAFTDNSSEEVREMINKLEEKNGSEWLYDELCRVDSKSAEKIHKNNIKRVKRALEIFYSKGIAKSKQDEISKNTEPIYDCLYIGINYKERQKLYDRINLRVDKMIENGLVEEVSNFYDIKELKTSSQAIGCKELKPYLDNENTLENCIENLKRASRKYAKRQITWFKRNEKINWFYPDENDFDYIINRSIELSEEFLKRR